MKLREKFLEFLTEDVAYHPLLLFIQISCLHIFRETGLEGVLLCLAIITTFTKLTNYYWFVGVFIMAGSSYVYLINFIFGFLSANQPWKLVIFIYLLGDSYLLDTQQQWLNYNAASLLLLSLYFLLRLPLNNHHDNKWYFCGFFSLFVLHLLKWSTWHFGIFNADGSMIMCIIAAVAISSSLRIINYRLNQVCNYSLDQIHSLQVFQIFMENLKKKIRQGLQSYGVQKEHQQQCCYVDCFCRSPYQYTTFGQMLVRQYYQWSLKKFYKGDDNEKAKQNVVWNYIQQNQLPLAIESYLKLGPYGLNFFHLTRKERLKRELQRQHHIVQQSYAIKERFQNAFDYEFNYEILKRSLIELITLKQAFWIEVNKQTSKLCVLQQISRQILDKFNQMHYFFLEKVSRLQNEINVYNGSILYNLFLLQATNYHQMAQANMKNIRKINTSSEVYRDSRSFFVKVSMKTETLLQIQMATANLTKMIASSRDKSTYIGKSMMFLVPQCYSTEHQRGFKQLHGYNFNNLLGINVNPIFFLDSFGYIKTCNVVVKYSTDIQNQLSIIGHVKLLNDDNDYILVNPDGIILEKSNEKVQVKLLQFQQIKECFRKFKNKWSEVNIIGQTYPVLDSMKRQIRLQDNYFTCVVNSPFAGSFRFPRVPPIHVAIHNETQNYVPSSEESDDEEVKGCMNKINALVDRDDNASRCTTSTGGAYHASIIKKVEEIKTPNIFNRYIFYISLISLVLCAFTIKNYLNYDDDPTECDQFEIITSLYKVEYLIAKSITRSLTLLSLNSVIEPVSGGSNGDINGEVNGDMNGDVVPPIILPIIQPINNQSLNNLPIIIEPIDQSIINQSINIPIINPNQYFPANDPNFLQSIHQYLKNTSLTLRTLILQDIMWRKARNSYNIYRESYIKVTSPRATHYMTVAGIISKALSDIIQLSNGIPFSDVVLYDIYWMHTMPTIRKLIKVLIQSVKQHIKEQQKLNIINIGVQLFIVLLFSLGIILINRRISSLEITVFELIISIHEKFVNEQLQDLRDLSNNIRSSNNNLNATMKSVNNLENSSERELRHDQAVFNAVTNEDGKKRVGQLDLKGSTKRGYPLFIILIIGILSILSSSLLDRMTIQNNQSTLTKEQSLNEWNNGRALLEAALKSTLFNNSDLSAFVNQLVNKRTNVSNLDLQSDNIQCNHPYLCRHDTSQLSLNMYIQQLTLELSTQKHIPKMILLESACDICDRIHEQGVAKRRQQFDRRRNQSAATQKNILTIGLVTQILCLMLGVAYIEWTKLEFRRATTVMTLMNETMITNNKRIDSYLQRLNKVV